MEDQVEGEVAADQTTQEQSGETDKAPEGLEPLVKGLQKGYTQTRQELSEIKESLEKLSSSKTEEGADEYITKSSLKGILTEHEKERIAENQKYQQQIQSAVGDLKDIGVVKNDKEAEELIDYAVKNHIPNLYSAAAKWQTEKAATAGTEAVRQAAETKAKQAEGAQVGTSQTTTTQESSGVPYAEIIRERYR